MADFNSNDSPSRPAGQKAVLPPTLLIFSYFLLALRRFLMPFFESDVAQVVFLLAECRAIALRHEIGTY
jgi:hypothetical protein